MAVATILWTLKSLNFTENPTFFIIFANFFEANFAWSSDFVPKHTNFPEEKTKQVALGYWILIIAPANLFGLY